MYAPEGGEEKHGRRFVFFLKTLSSKQFLLGNSVPSQVKLIFDLLSTDFAPFE